MQQVTVIDYGMGNLNSVLKKLNDLKIPCLVTSDPTVIKKAEKLILPGVGHFGKAMENIKQLGIQDALNEAVIINKKPILGICLGMQLMTKFSEEGNTQGLNWIDAEVLKFNTKDKLRFKVPHMGWNQIHIKKESRLLKDIEENSEFYFVHSFFVKVNNQQDELTSTNYEEVFTSAFEKDNMFGVQFHPEKSHDVGLKLIQNFIQL